MLLNFKKYYQLSSISKTPQKILPLYKRAQTKRALLNDVVHLSVLFPPPTQNLHKSKTLAECRDKETTRAKKKKRCRRLCWRWHVRRTRKWSALSGSLWRISKRSRPLQKTASTRATELAVWLIKLLIPLTDSYDFDNFMRNLGNLGKFVLVMVIDLLRFVSFCW